MLEPYLDADGCQTGHAGLDFIDPAELPRFVTALDREGFQVHFHALGDRAVRIALDAIEAGGTRHRANGATRATAHHLAHLQVVHPDDIARFAQLSATANIQPLWAAHEPQMDELTIPFLGERRAGWQYPFGSLLAAGAPMCAGSDWPVSSPDPLLGAHVAVNRTLPGAHGAGRTRPVPARAAIGLPADPRRLHLGQREGERPGSTSPARSGRAWTPTSPWSTPTSAAPRPRSAWRRSADLDSRQSSSTSAAQAARPPPLIRPAPAQRSMNGGQMAGDRPAAACRGRGSDARSWLPPAVARQRSNGSSGTISPTKGLVATTAAARSRCLGDVGCLPGRELARPDLRLRLPGEHRHLAHVRVAARARRPTARSARAWRRSPTRRRRSWCSRSSRAASSGTATRSRAADVVYSLDRQMDPAYGGFYGAGVQPGAVDHGHRQRPGDDHAEAARLLARGRAGLDGRRRHPEELRGEGRQELRHAGRRRSCAPATTSSSPGRRAPA